MFSFVDGDFSFFVLGRWGWGVGGMFVLEHACVRACVRASVRACVCVVCVCVCSCH